jgi:hypothetical protein
MPDTRRSQSSLATLFADNTAGDISAQDGRDLVISAHPEKVIQTGPYASEPSSAQLTGDLYLPSDSFYLERFSGSAWTPWGPIFPMTKPPAAASFTAVNQGSATLTDSNGALFFTTPANASADAIHLFKKAAPSTPYTLTVAIVPLWGNANVGGQGIFCGILFRESSSAKIVFFNLESSTAAGMFGIDAMKWTDATTFSARYSLTLPSTSAGIIPASLIWLRITDDGTNRICSISYDSVNFLTIHSVGRTDFLTANEIGIGGYGYASQASFSILSWKEA